MTKTLKQLVHVLWAIEKDLHVIANNTEAIRQIRDDHKPVKGIEKLIPEDSEHTGKKILNHY